MIRNLRKARKSWDRLSRILGREGSSPRVSGMLFKEVVQAVIIFGAEAWVMTPHIGRYLGGLQHRVAQRITGRQPRWILQAVRIDNTLQILEADHIGFG